MKFPNSALFHRADWMLPIALLTASLLVTPPDAAAQTASASQFTTGQYQVVLGRDPDAPGYAYWFPLLYGGAISQNALSSAFVTSDEYKADYWVSGQEPAVSAFVNQLYENGFASEYASPSNPNLVSTWTTNVTNDDTQRPQAASAFINDSGYFTQSRAAYCTAYVDGKAGVSGSVTTGQYFTFYFTNACGLSDAAYGNITIGTGLSTCIINWDARTQAVGGQGLCSVSYSGNAFQPTSDGFSVTAYFMSFSQGFVGSQSVSAGGFNMQNLYADSWVGSLTVGGGSPPSPGLSVTPSSMSIGANYSTGCTVSTSGTSGALNLSASYTPAPPVPSTCPAPCAPPNMIFTPSYTLSSGSGSATLTIYPTAFTPNGTVTVTASGSGYTTQSAPITLQVTSSPPITVTVTPGPTVTLIPSQQQPFTVTVANTSNTAVTWSVTSGVGTVSSSGVYTAPSNPGAQDTAVVTATSQQDSSKSASVSVNFAVVYCSDEGNYTVDGTTTAVRLNGNLLKLYSQTSVVGDPFAPYMQTYLTTSLYLNGAILNACGPNNNQSCQNYQDNGPSLGVTAWRSYEPTLQTWGPGTYRIDAHHAVYNYYCGTSQPPFSNNPTGNNSASITVQRPTLSMGVDPYYLGPGQSMSNDYSSETQITSSPNGATETPHYFFVAGSGFGTLSCNSCQASTFTATASPSGNCGSYDVVLKADFNGFQSDPFWIDINQPNKLVPVRSVAAPQNLQYTPPQQGWKTDIYYRVFDRCDNQMTNVEMNEVFTGFSGKYPDIIRGWPLPLLATGFPSLQWDLPTSSWLFMDELYEYGDLTTCTVPGDLTTCSKYPMPWTTGTNGNSETADAWVTWHSQQLRVGSQNNGGYFVSSNWPQQGNPAIAKGVLVQTNDHNHYLDHGAHSGQVSPVQ